MSRFKFLVLHGPNLGRLSQRSSTHYGGLSLDGLNEQIAKATLAVGVDVEIRQSDHEGDLVSWIGESHLGFAGVVINPGGYAHTSVAIHDAIELARVPVVEVHLSHLWAREPWRTELRTAAAALGIVSGFGADSYRLGVLALIGYLTAGRDGNRHQAT